jgi:RNA polymerase sigma-70 factor, ECF subfamily
MTPLDRGMSESASGTGFRHSEVPSPREEFLRACMLRVSAGSEDALAAIYDSTSALVYSIATSMLGDRADAEEVTLDVFSQVWRTASGFRAERGTVTAWLITMARTRSIDRLRSRRRRAAEQQETDILLDRAADDPSPLESTMAGEQGQRVRTAMQALPENQRRLIELACYGGYSQSELAEKLGLPLGTVKTRMRMGLGTLRDLLAVSR